MTYFENISPQTWEHPADKAALNALRSLKGFDQLLKKFMSVTNERQEKLKLLSTCIRATEKNYPELYEIRNNIVKVFGWKFIPDLFVKKANELDSDTGGAKEPYIIINSGSVKNLTKEEITYILGHELGHIMSGHVLYETMLDYVMALIEGATDSNIRRSTSINIHDITRMIPVFGETIDGLIGLSIKPIALALAAWSRKSELTADRAGLLALQNVSICKKLELKLAGFDDSSNIDLDDLYKQAMEYDSYNSAIDNIYKINNSQDNPDSIIRIKELEAWVASGKYNEIISGNYIRLDDGTENKELPTAKKFCGNCGKPIAGGNFCPHCGAKL